MVIITVVNVNGGATRTTAWNRPQNETMGRKPKRRTKSVKH